MTISRDFKMDTVNQEIRATAVRHEQKLHNHDNVAVLQMLDNSNVVRRLKRTKPGTWCSEH